MTVLAAPLTKALVAPLMTELEGLVSLASEVLAIAVSAAEEAAQLFAAANTASLCIS